MKMKSILFAAGASALACGAASGATNTWQGVNTVALHSYLSGLGLPTPYDLPTYKYAGIASTNGYDLWSEGGVPGPGDHARFNWNNANSSVWSYTADRVVLDGDFNPDSMSITANSNIQQLYGGNSSVQLGKHLSLENLMVSMNGGGGGMGEGQFIIPAGWSLTLTGATPFTWSGTRSGISSINSSGVLRFDAPSTTFTAGALTGALAGLGEIEFVAPNAQIAPAGTHFGANIIHLRPDQTFTAPDSLASFSQSAIRDTTNFVSITGGKLGNLADLSLYLAEGNQVSGGATYHLYVYGAPLRALTVKKSSSTIPMSGVFHPTDDLELRGGIVSGGANPVESNVSLLVHGEGMGTGILSLDGRSLTTARSVEIRSSMTIDRWNGQSITASSRLVADGANVDIGGDLVYTNTCAATHPAYYHSTQGLKERRDTGMTGDAGTVVTLRGNFASDMRASTYANFAPVTLNLVGGSRGAPNTYEIGNAPDDVVASGTFSIGKLNIGSGAEPGFVKLVNNYTNDGTLASSESWDTGAPVTTWFRMKDTEIQVVRDLAISAGSRLDLNGKTLKLAPGYGESGLEIADGGQLDLRTGIAPVLALQGTVITNMVGVGDRFDAWDAASAGVFDSTLPGVTFRPLVTKISTLPLDGSKNELMFNGANDRVNLQSGGDGLGTTTAAVTNFTVEAWVKAAVQDKGYNHILMRSSRNTTNGDGPAVGTSLYWLGVHENGTWAACARGNLNVASPAPALGLQSGDTGIPVEYGVWHHLALAYDGVTQKTYLDGALVAEAGNFAKPIVNGVGGNNQIGLDLASISIGGANARPAVRQFDGSIAEVRVWNVARTQLEIQSTMNTRLTGTEAGLSACWPLSEGAGTVAHELVGGLNGVLAGAPLPEWDAGNTYWKIGPGHATIIMVR